MRGRAILTSAERVNSPLWIQYRPIAEGGRKESYGEIARDYLRHYLHRFSPVDLS